MRLLLAEDDCTLGPELKRRLERAGLAVDLAGDGVTAESLADSEPYDAVVLDLGLPRRDGLSVLRNWRGRGNRVPVLILTARGEWQQKVTGFQAGADDYLAKPFHFPELVARIGALSRRAPSAPPVLRRGELALDRPRRRASRNGQLVPLTRKELGVLEVLMSADGAVISAEQLLERVWDEYADPFTNAVAVTVMRLRRKLGQPPLIETVTGGGYRLP
jgi:DNA-binding response OmpR family regulator